MIEEGVSTFRKPNTIFVQFSQSGESLIESSQGIIYQHQEKTVNELRCSICGYPQITKDALFDHEIKCELEQAMACESEAAYRETHKDELLAKNKAYRETHKDELLAYQRQRRAAHRSVA